MISKREKEAGYPPSNPQMQVGTNIATILPQIESRLFPTVTETTSQPEIAQPTSVIPSLHLPAMKIPSQHKIAAVDSPK